MKKTLLSLTSLLLIALTLNHGASALNAAGNNVHASYLKECDPGTVKFRKADLLGLTTAVEIEGWNCAGSDSKGSGYRSEVYDHFFRLL